MGDYLFSYATPEDPLVKRGLIRLIEKSTGQPRLKALYLQNQKHPRPNESFWQAAVRSLDLDVQFDRAALARIPKSGPLVVVANHPYGVLDGVVISWLIEKVRPDFHVLTNAVLMRAPEIRRFILPGRLFRHRRGAEDQSGFARRRARRAGAGRGCCGVSRRRRRDRARSARAQARDRRALANVRGAIDPAQPSARRADLVRRTEQSAVSDRQPHEPDVASLADLSRSEGADRRQPVGRDRRARSPSRRSPTSRTGKRWSTTCASEPTPWLCRPPRAKPRRENSCKPSSG